MARRRRAKRTPPMLQGYRGFDVVNPLNKEERTRSDIGLRHQLVFYYFIRALCRMSSFQRAEASRPRPLVVGPVEVICYSQKWPWAEIESVESAAVKNCGERGESRLTLRALAAATPTHTTRNPGRKKTEKNRKPGNPFSPSLSLSHFFPRSSYPSVFPIVAICLLGR